jgi:hypothetical protein
VRISELLKYGFNVIISKRLSSERKMPDTRNKKVFENII